MENKKERSIFRTLLRKYNFITMLLILFPAFNCNFSDVNFAESVYESACQTGICNKRNVKIDSVTTNLITILQLALRKVFRDVNHQIKLLLTNHIQTIWLIARVWPSNECIFNTTLGKEFRCSFSCKYFKPFIF